MNGVISIQTFICGHSLRKALWPLLRMRWNDGHVEASQKKVSVAGSVSWLKSCFSWLTQLATGFNATEFLAKAKFS